jgi:ATP-dependent RNA helicase DDX19/DBP5
MTAEGHKVVSLHGTLEAADRDARMTSFRDGKTKVLITTNVIARGIDVLQVNMVVKCAVCGLVCINDRVSVHSYDIPLDANNQPDAETYIHRIGAATTNSRSFLVVTNGSA